MYYLNSDHHPCTSSGELLTDAHPEWAAFIRWAFEGGIAQPLPLVTPSTCRAALAAEYEVRMAPIAAAYPPSERESWPVQTEEARRLLDDVEASTPWIDAAASARGLDRVTLAERIIEKATAYAAISGAMTGARQAIEDQIDAAGDDHELLAAIDVMAGWPAESTALMRSPV